MDKVAIQQDDNIVNDEPVSHAWLDELGLFMQRVQSEYEADVKLAFERRQAKLKGTLRVIEGWAEHGAPQPEDKLWIARSRRNVYKVGRKPDTDRQQSE